MIKINSFVCACTVLQVLLFVNVCVYLNSAEYKSLLNQEPSATTYYTMTLILSVIEAIFLSLFFFAHLHFIWYEDEEKLSLIKNGWKLNQFLMVLDFIFLCYERNTGIINKPGTYLFSKFIFNIMFHILTAFIRTRLTKYIEDKEKV